MVIVSDERPWWKGGRGAPYVLVQLLLFALILFGPRELPGLPRWGQPWSLVTLVIGLLLGSAGLLLVFAGIASLGRNLTIFPQPRPDSTLVESGAYAYVRHPIYSGAILGAVGWALVWASPAALLYALILFLFFDVKSRREEKWLVERFPAYASYQRRVHKLIPFVY
jgi:protein-S-isoprenylcysteine O-methyltransferase Ste14